MEKLTNAVIVKITKHSNFIVGYKEGEVVVIPVDSELKEYGEAYIFNKRNKYKLFLLFFTTQNFIIINNIIKSNKYCEYIKSII